MFNTNSFGQGFNQQPQQPTLQDLKNFCSGFLNKFMNNNNFNHNNMTPDQILNLLGQWKQELYSKANNNQQLNDNEKYYLNNVDNFVQYYTYILTELAKQQKANANLTNFNNSGLNLGSSNNGMNFHNTSNTQSSSNIDKSLFSNNTSTNRHMKRRHINSDHSQHQVQPELIPELPVKILTGHEYKLFTGPGIKVIREKDEYNIIQNKITLIGEVKMEKIELKKDVTGIVCHYPQDLVDFMEREAHNANANAYYCKTATRSYFLKSGTRRPDDFLVGILENSKDLKEFIINFNNKLENAEPIKNKLNTLWTPIMNTLLAANKPFIKYLNGEEVNAVSEGVFSDFNILLDHEFQSSITDESKIKILKISMEFFQILKNSISIIKENYGDVAALSDVNESNKLSNGFKYIPIGINVPMMWINEKDVSEYIQKQDYAYYLAPDGSSAIPEFKEINSVAANQLYNLLSELDFIMLEIITENYKKYTVIKTDGKILIAKN